MKTTIIVFAFIAFLLAYGFYVATTYPLMQEDKVQMQQLELVKSTFAERLNETTTFVTDNSELPQTEAFATTAIVPEMEVEVAIKGNRFHPENLTIPKGTKVHWINMDMIPHTLTYDPVAGSDVIPDFGINLLRPGDRLYHTFEESGTWYYECPQHGKDYHGTITVID